MKIKVLLSISVCINVIFIIVVIASRYNRKQQENAVVLSQESQDLYIKSYDNFDSVFFKKNDDLYRKLWNEAMENDPEQAFLMACAYYYLTKNDKIRFTIDDAYGQLKIIYHK